MACLTRKQDATRPGQATVRLQRGSCTVIVGSVPAEVCDGCGEYYLGGTASPDVLRPADAAGRDRTDLHMLAYTT